MASLRSVASNVTVSFGLVSFPVDLVPAVVSKQAKATRASTAKICPVCKEAGGLHRVRQQYVCGHDAEHGPFGQSGVATALVVDGELSLPSDDVVAELAEVSGVREVIELTVHPAGEVEQHTLATGNIYRLRPVGNEAHYGLVLELARNPQVAFVCEVTNKGATKLYRLVTHLGALMLTELARPDQLQPAEPVGDVGFDERLLATGESLVANMVMPFEPDQYLDRRHQRLAALAEQAASVVSIEPGSVADVAGNLLELLRRSVDAAAA
jgi:non-homologous end joining protein Ku